MQARREFRDRDAADVAVLDTLVDHQEEGMTVLGLRARTDLDIDAIEEALTGLKEAELIRVDRDGNETTLYPAARVIPETNETDTTTSPLEWLRERLPF